MDNNEPDRRDRRAFKAAVLRGFISGITRFVAAWIIDSLMG